MTQALSKIEREQQLSQEDIDLVKKTVAAGATESEFKLFLYIAQRYNLDPLVKQIWLIKYGNQPAAIFTSRDGFLSIGHRSGQFDGMETKAIKDEAGRVIGAVCNVWRRDMSHPFTVEVSRSEYDTGKGNWQKMPETMIKKVAESQCLRRAFDISGLYDPSEFDPSDNYQSHQEVVERPRTVTPTPTPSVTPQQPAQPPTDPFKDKFYLHYSKEFANAKTLKDLEGYAEVMKLEVTDEAILEPLRAEYAQARARIKKLAEKVVDDFEMAFN